MRNFEVVIVQSGFSLEDYLSVEAFHKKVENLFNAAFADTFVNAKSDNRESYGTIVVFPELTGLWLPVFVGNPGLVLKSDLSKLSIKKLISKAVFTHPLKLLLSVVAGKSLSFVFRNRWKEAFYAWIEPFIRAARRYGVYVCPGSSFIPYIDYDVVMGFSAKGSNIYNTSCLISGEGKILGFTRKVNLTLDELKLGITPGSATEFRGYVTGLGRVGILICLDGFYTGAVESLDRDGCELIIQPSANPLEWIKPPREGTSITQEEEWLGNGLGSLIQGRESILVSVNPMSVSSVMNHTDQGRSNVFVNLSRVREKSFSIDTDVRWLPKNDRFLGLSVVASTYSREEIIKFRGVFADGE